MEQISNHVIAQAFEVLAETIREQERQDASLRAYNKGMEILTALHKTMSEREPLAAEFFRKNIHVLLNDISLAVEDDDGAVESVVERYRDVLALSDSVRDVTT